MDQSVPPRQRADRSPLNTRPDDPAETLRALFESVIDNREFINTIADALRANPGGLRGPPGPPGQGGGGNQDHTPWRADEVGFFFPDLSEYYGNSDIVTIGKDSYYLNSSVFLSRIDDVVKLKGAEVVRTNLSTCFRGAAMQWYTNELTDEEKQLVRGPSIHNNNNAIHR
jgi:hypothetical protein